MLKHEVRPTGPYQLYQLSTGNCRALGAALLWSIVQALKMISRATLARGGPRAFQSRTQSNATRCLATAASGSFSYETADVNGVKIASRDLPGPTTHLAVVAKAGTRYQPLPGFSEGLEKFSFKVSCIGRQSPIYTQLAALA